MSFDANKFRFAALEARTARVPVPDLMAFFADGAEPVWVVRGLSGEEVARANDANSNVERVRAAVEALSARAGAGQTEALKTILGTATEVPEDLAKRFDHLTVGSVEPAIDRDIAIRLFRFFPVVAYALTNKILELTGKGADVGKLQGSGEIPA